MEGKGGNPWCFSCDNAVCCKLWAGLICFFGTIAGIITMLLTHHPLLIAYLGVLILVALTVSLVLMLLSCRACWLKPPYQSLIDNGGTLLTPEKEAELVSLDEPWNSFTYVGTHNSCHVCSLFGGLFIPAFQYTHASLKDQLQIGIRHIELDIWYNRYLQRWEIWHEAVDPLAVSHFLLSDVLRFLHHWSLDTPEHFPLNINLDIKGAYQPGTTLCVPFFTGRGLGGTEMQDEVSDCLKCCAIDTDAEEAFGVLDEEIRRVWVDQTRLFEPSRLLDEGETSVARAIAQNGWPRIGLLKGCTMFFLNIYGPKKWLQREASGKCFFPRANGDTDNEDCVYFEPGSDSYLPISAQLRAKNAVSRGFYSDSSTMQLNVEAGLGLVSTDSPTELNCDSVFLRTNNQKDHIDVI